MAEILGLSSQYDYDALEAQIEASKRSAESQIKAANIAASASKSIAKGNWKVQREQIRSQLKMAAQEIKFRRDEMIRIGIPEMEANRRYQEEQIRLGDQAHGLAKAQLGLDYLKFASTLSGPENYFQAANFYRGAAASGAPASFLDALNQNAGVSVFQGTGGQAPRPLTAQGIAFGLTGQAGGVPGSVDQATQDAQNLASIDKLTSRAGGSLAPGSLEALDENELALVASGGGALGRDVPRWLRDYQRARMGSESVLAA
jgi:hypothetical protein